MLLQTLLRRRQFIMTFTGRQSRRWSNQGVLNSVEENGKHFQHWKNYFESHSYISCIYFFFISKLFFPRKGERVGRVGATQLCTYRTEWTHSFVVLGSAFPPSFWLDLSSVAANSTPWLRFVNKQLVCFQAAGVFNYSTCMVI